MRELGLEVKANVNVSGTTTQAQLSRHCQHGRGGSAGRQSAGARRDACRRAAQSCIFPVLSSTLAATQRHRGRSHPAQSASAISAEPMSTSCHMRGAEPPWIDGNPRARCRDGDLGLCATRCPSGRAPKRRRAPVRAQVEVAGSSAQVCRCTQAIGRCRRDAQQIRPRYLASVVSEPAAVPARTPSDDRIGNPRQRSWWRDRCCSLCAFPIRPRMACANRLRWRRRGVSWPVSVDAEAAGRAEPQRAHSLRPTRFYRTARASSGASEARAT